VLLPGKSLLLGGGQNVAVLYNASGTVMIEA
jgi:hypothetical protein